MLRGCILQATCCVLAEQSSEVQVQVTPFNVSCNFVIKDTRSCLIIFNNIFSKLNSLVVLSNIEYVMQDVHLKHGKGCM